MKSQRGITLTVLAATVVIMAIIVGSISYSSISGVRMREYYNMCADVEVLDGKIAIYYIENGEIPVLKNDVKNVEELIGAYSVTDANYNPNNSGILYKVDLSKLNNLSLSNDEYYIDEKSHTIYSSSGIKIDDQIYYTVPLEYEKVDLNLYR